MNKSLKDSWLYDLVVHSGFLLAAGGGAMAITGLLAMGAAVRFETAVISTLVVYAVYQANRATEADADAETHAERTSFVQKHSKLLNSLAIAGLLVSGAIALFGTFSSMLFLLLLVLFALSYSIKFVPKSLGKKIGFRRLKEIPLLKAAIPSFGWGALTSVYSFAFYGEAITYGVLTFGLFVFLRFFVNANTFDLRDVKSDEKEGVRTIPVVFGYEGGRMASHLLNLGAGVVAAASVALGWWKPEAAALALFTLYGFYFIQKMREKHADKDFLCDVIVDGEYVLWIPLVLAAGLYL